MTIGKHPASVADWNNTRHPFSAQLSIVGLLDSAAVRYASYPAVRTIDGVALTHAQLAAQSAALARRLIALGVSPGRPVAVLADHVPETVAAIHAVVRAGAYFVPLDPRWPRRRMAEILGSVKVAHALATAAYAERLAGLIDGLTVITLPRAGDDDPPLALTGLPEPGPADLAYAIFTSGSTGKPKAVAVRHTSVVNLAEWFNRRHGIGPDDIMLQVASFSFDLSVYDVFGVLAAGASLLLLPDTALEEPEEVAAALVKHGATLWNSAPAMFTVTAMFLDDALDGERGVLRRVFLSGDWIPLGTPGIVRREFPNATLVALGGATEACVWSNDYIVTECDPSWRSIPYGTPMQNSRYYVLREDGNPCAVGEAGELYIAGVCVAAGYLNDPVASAARFTADPWAQGEGWQMYRTGDRARWTPAGWVEFLGRRDFQVKVRGFRIELGEIDCAAAQICAVEEAVTLAIGDSRDPVLAIALRTAVNLEVAEIRDRLGEWLPDFMIPRRALVLQSFPVGNTGKTDRAALRAMFEEGAGVSLHA